MLLKRDQTAKTIKVFSVCVQYTHRAARRINVDGNLNAPQFVALNKNRTNSSAADLYCQTNARDHWRALMFRAKPAFRDREAPVTPPHTVSQTFRPPCNRAISNEMFGNLPGTLRFMQPFPGGALRDLLHCSLSCKFQIGTTASPTGIMSHLKKRHFMLASARWTSILI